VSPSRAITAAALGDLIVEAPDVNQSMTVIQYEETVDIANIQPQASIMYELNCQEQMIRELGSVLIWLCAAKPASDPNNN
jgi:hypothetical protein